VRVHIDNESVQLNRKLNAEAFTVGRDIYFGAGRYSPYTSSGRKILAHELTHVVQQGRRPNAIQCWGAGGHERITGEAGRAVDLDGFFVHQLKSPSAAMDFRSAALWYNFNVVVRDSATPANEAPNHGEGGLYTMRDRTSAARINEVRQEWYLNNAIRLEKEFKDLQKKHVPVHRLGSKASEIYEQLGHALHVAQDRGSHEEGLDGRGHEQRDIDCDDISENPEGYNIAKRNSIEVLQRFKSARGY